MANQPDAHRPPLWFVALIQLESTQRLYSASRYLLFRAGERLRGLRELMGLSRSKFAQLVGMKPKRLENIENGLQRMHDEDFEKVCGTFEEFSRWITYEGPIEPQSIALKIADSAQKAAVYLVEHNPALLEKNGIDIEAWRQRHQSVLNKLREAEASEDANNRPIDKPS